MSLTVVPVPCLSDNYAYLVACDATGDVAIVDPSEAPPVLAALDAHGMRARVKTILCTHHHYDHVDGAKPLAEALGIKDVVGSTHDAKGGRIAGQTRSVDDGSTLTLGKLPVRVLAVPGHTLGAVAYVVGEGASAAVFTGDTLFLGGCGRLFEGDPPMMLASLAKLAALDPRTRVYCGHEYTEANLRFAAHVDPTNAAVKTAQARARAERAAGKPTVPGTIAEEHATNPFLRAPDAEVLGRLRMEKNTFR